MRGLLSPQVLTGLGFIFASAVVVTVVPRPGAVIPTSDMCRGAAGMQAAAERAALVRRALESSELECADATAKTVEAELRAWAMHWGEHREAACEAAGFFGERSQNVREQRMLCFDRLWVQFVAINEQLIELGGSPRTITQAPRIVASLPWLSACDSVVAVPDYSGLELDAFVSIAKAEVLQLVGETEAVEALVSRALAVDAGLRSDSEPLLRAMALRAELNARDRTVGFPDIRRLAETAAMAKEHQLEANLRLRFATNLGGRPLPAALKRWAVDDATFALERVEAPKDDPRRAVIARIVARAQTLSGDDWGANKGLVVALEHADGLGPSVTQPLRLGLADSLRRQHEYEESRAIYLSVREQDRERWGDGHPHVARDDHLLGRLEADAGRPEAGLDLIRRAVDRLESTVGPDDSMTLRARIDLADIAVRSGQLDEDFVTRLPAIERTLGSHDADTLRANRIHGLALGRAGQYAEAVAAYDRVLQIMSSEFRVDMTWTGLLSQGRVLAERGNAYLGQQDFERALTDFNAAIVKLKPLLGSEGIEIATALRGRAQAHLGVGDYWAARADLSDALMATGDVQVESLWIAETRLLLARALRGTGHRTVLHLNEAREARDRFVELGLDARAAELEAEFDLEKEH